MVTRNPGPWFDDALAALAAQDYPNLAVLVIDAASDTDPTARVASVLPDAYVIRLDTNPGFGAAANRVREVVDGAAFYCFLHDDAAPTPRALSTMVGEALRSNAGVVGCKLVQHDDPRRLLQVGEAADKTGERVATVDPGELDQEQHDAVRDVFVVPGGAMLVRSDLFDAIGGFDDGIDVLNDDLNLCWRAHVAGGRVVVAPDAVVRHHEALGERLPVDERRRRLMRHRIRTMLVCYGPWHRLRVVPQAVFVSVLEVLYSLVVGRRRQAADVVQAWRWNLARRDEIAAWRTRVQAFRTVPDAEIRRLQLRGSARVVRFLRGQGGRGGSRSDRAQAVFRRAVDGMRDGSLHWPVAAWAATIAIVAFGSRHLLFQPIAAVGGFLPFDASPADLLRSYLSGWRDVGLGVEAPAPTGFGLLGVLGGLFFGAMGTLRRVLLLGSLVVGLVGAFRLLRPTRSPRAQAVALVVYGAAPLAYDAVAGARWGALTVYAATPWLVGILARAGDLAPFERPGRPTASKLGEIAALGLLVAVVGAVEPAFVPLVLVVALALALGSVLTGDMRNVGRLLSVAFGGVAVAVVLHVPWTFEFVLPGATWDMVVGTTSTDALDLGELLRFHVGPVGSSSLVFGLAVGATLPLWIGREWRFAWAARAWTVSLVLLGLAWAGAQDWLPLAVPAPDVMLAPVALGFALAAAMGVAAFEIDLRAYGFGWRQVVTALSGVALLVGALPTLLDAGDGRWYLPADGLEGTFGFLEEEEPGFRVLWVGDPDVVPVPGHPIADDDTDADLVYATTDDGLVTLTDGWPGAPTGSTGLVEDALGIALDGQTNRLGRMLAPMAIRYVVLPQAAAPRPLGGLQRPTPPALSEALGAQLDLSQVAVNPAYVVYRNEAALSTRTALPATAGDTSPFAVSAEDLAGAEAVLTDAAGRTRFEGSVATGRILHSVTASDGWSLTVDGRTVPRQKLFGWAGGYEVEDAGRGVLRYDTDPLRYGMVLLQVVFWGLAIATVVRSKRTQRAAVLDGPEELA